MEGKYRGLMGMVHHKARIATSFSWPHRFTLPSIACSTLKWLQTNGLLTWKTAPQVSLRDESDTLRPDLHMAAASGWFFFTQVAGGLPLGEMHPPPTACHIRTTWLLMKTGVSDSSIGGHSNIYGANWKHYSFQIITYLLKLVIDLR